MLSINWAPSMCSSDPARWPESALSFPGHLMGHVSFKLSVVSTFKCPGTEKTSEAIVDHFVDLFR